MAKGGGYDHTSSTSYCYNEKMQLIQCPGQKLAGIIAGATIGGLLLIIVVWVLIKDFAERRAKKAKNKEMKDCEDPYPSYREPPTPWYRRILPKAMFRYNRVANPAIDPGPYLPPKEISKEPLEPTDGQDNEDSKSNYSATSESLEGPSLYSVPYDYPAYHAPSSAPVTEPSIPPVPQYPMPISVPPPPYMPNTRG
ncbi:uncharacterized protein EI90DRAFT_2379061 [Cantharellus anzutake]|uniref:uncharacterized protein n=1 Tax=Cantharellus anzutake TaxID=1750568 RepID=UPI001904BB51|nr:uncharacterized protein EI90DRAFT_2379061 [Cantharellus anzutake]KAF8323460.1 hypothetical protein EI90DRAFT_2379061 [Cantharellus anzutake]